MVHRTSIPIRTLFAYITVFIVPLWTPISTWITHFDGARRIPLVLLIVSLLLFYQDVGKIIKQKPFIAYIVFASLLIINGIVQGGYLNYDENIANGKYVMFVTVFCPLLYMIIISCLATTDFETTLSWVTWSLLLYCILCLVYGTMDEEGRFGGELNANGIATYGNFCFFCLLLQFMLKKRSLFSLIIFSIIPAYLIVMSGSRAAFGLLAFSAVLSSFLFYNKKNKGSFLLMVSLSVVLAFGIIYVMNNTVVGERLQETSTQMDNLTELQTGTVLDKFGDRGPQYYWSWPYFKEHPIWGIGFNNWREVSGSPTVFHSEWLVQYCENGIFALLLYLFFYISLFRKAIGAIKTSNEYEKRVILVIIYSLISIAFLNFVSWTYDTFCVFAFYAFAFAFSERIEERMSINSAKHY